MDNNVGKIGSLAGGSSASDNGVGDMSSLPSFDNVQSFGAGKMEVIGGRPLPPAQIGDSNINEVFNQSKLEAISGRNFPKQQQGASTLEINDIGNVDKLGAFPN